MKKVIVVKLGTAAITTPDGLLHKSLLQNICQQLAKLHQQYHLILVSSGAVGSGKPFIKNYKGSINQKKAAAALGNPLLMGAYAAHFKKENLLVAQCLLERNHFNQRERFVQLKATITELWKNDIIPIANDNDVVNDRELRFSDNDELATLLAVAFDAERLLIGSSVAGLLDDKGNMLDRVDSLDERIFGFVKPEKSTQGLGGMASKLSHTRVATSMGIETVIFNAKVPGNILKANEGQTGTLFEAQKSTLNARKRWLLSGKPHGTVVVDAGAEKAILNRKSLLSVGVVSTEGLFLKGELIDILNPSGVLLAMASSKINASAWSREIPGQLVAHANDISLI